MELQELKILRENYASFDNVMTDVEHLAPHFVEKGIIVTGELEEIKNTVKNSKKVAILLRNVTQQLESQNTTGFYDMLRIMEVHGLIATQDLASKIIELLSDCGNQRGETEGTSNVCSYTCMHLHPLRLHTYLYNYTN